MPAEDPRFTVRTDRPLLPAEPSERLLQVALEVPRPAGEAARKPVHLSLVIDRSGSMSGDKLRLALHAAREAIRSLREGDRFSVVTFDEQIEVPVPSTEATPEARLRAEAVLGTVTARGSTDLGGGWLRGCSEVEAHLPDDAVGRCLLLTDGQANHGITSPDELTRRAQDLRRRRVTTSTIGLGEGFNELLLSRLSEEGGGNFYFAASAAQLPGFVASEIGEVLSVVARDAAVIVHAPPDVDVESLNDYPCARDGKTSSFSLGSLSAGLALAPTFRLRFPGGPVGEALSVTVRLADRDGALPTEHRIQPFTRAAGPEVAAQAVDFDVIRAAAGFDSARARRAALELHRAGQWKEAGSRLTEAATRVRGYAAGDEASLRQADQLDAEKADYSQEMTELGRKGAHYRTMLAMKMRHVARPDGRAVALPTSPALQPQAAAATRALSGLPGAPVFGMESALVSPRSQTGTLSPDDERRLAADALDVEPTAVKVVFTEQAHADGWFSHWHDRERVAVISVAGVDRLIRSPVAAFVAYELVLHGLRALQGGYDPAKLFHAETRACLFDLCPNKADVAIKLQAGHICAPCLRELSTLGLDGDAVLALWRKVQALAQSRA